MTNPMMTLWWLSGVKIFKDILSLFLYWAKRFIPEERLRKINLGFGIVLFLLAVYSIVTSLRALIIPG